MYANDTHSCSKPNEVVVNHVSLKLNIDFEKKCAQGTSTLSLIRKPKPMPPKLASEAINFKNHIDWSVFLK